MERIPVPPDVNTELNNLLTSIMDAATPLPLILNSAPTTTNKLLKEGQVGIFGSSLFKTINGTTYEIPMTAR